AATAAGTSLLSRRWRSLWTGLRKLVFHDIPFELLEEVLSRFSPNVSLLEIRIPEQPGDIANTAGHLNSLLRAAARLEPEEFIFTVPSSLARVCAEINLPCFHRAKSIVVHFDSFITLEPTDGEEHFSALKTLSLTGSNVTDAEAFLRRCQRLRSFTIWAPTIVLGDDLRVHSTSLLELIVAVTTAWGELIDIDAPELKVLFVAMFAFENANISVSVPNVEKLSWSCLYARGTNGFGLWNLEKVTLLKAPGEGQPPSLTIQACNASRYIFPEAASLVQEIQKHMVTEFSVLEICLRTTGHAFGAFVSLILGMRPIRTDVKRLKVVIWRPRVERACEPNCPCEPLTGWRTQEISLPALEEVEISGFEFGNHDFEFLRLISRSAPMLKTLSVSLLPRGIPSRNDLRAKVRNILGAHSSVEFTLDLSSAMEGSQNGPLT
ncbi:hypothetical protein BRADI_4g42470v3, partial [Brachypodium distachyon]